jgi:hypothetical protein
LKTSVGVACVYVTLACRLSINKICKEFITDLLMVSYCEEMEIRERERERR